MNTYIFFFLHNIISFFFFFGPGLHFIVYKSVVDMKRSDILVWSKRFPRLCLPRIKEQQQNIFKENQRERLNAYKSYLTFLFFIVKAIILYLSVSSYFSPFPSVSCSFEMNNEEALITINYFM